MHQHLVFLFTIELSSGQEPFSCLPLGHTQMIRCMQEIKFQSDSDVFLTDILECIKYLGINHFDEFFSDEQRDSSMRTYWGILNLNILAVPPPSYQKLFEQSMC